jgi:predicted TIM-barrel fold metal-dependent hydrolase
LPRKSLKPFATISRVIQRRHFLSLAAAAAAPASAPGIIDTHTHFYDPRRRQGVPWPPKTDALLYRHVLPDEFTAMVRPLGVTGTVVVEASPWVEDNQWILDLARDEPFIVGLVGSLAPAAPGFGRHLDRFQKNPLFLGIRLGGAALRTGLDQAEFVSGLRLLASRGLMLDTLGGAGMLPDIVRLAGLIAQLRIVIDHMPFDPPASAEVLRQLAPLPQVYCKVSNVLRRREGDLITDAAHYRPALDELWETFGERRLIYGSNWPVSGKVGPYPEVLRVVRNYFESKGRPASALYFRENAKTAYRWIDRR